MSVTPTPARAPSLRVRISGRVYDATATFDRLPLGDILRLESETRDFGRAMTWSQIRGLMDRLIHIGVEAEIHERLKREGPPPPGLEADDEFPWFVALMVWGARTMAGDHVTFTEAVSIPLTDIEFIVDDADDGGGAGDPRRARPGSGRAGVKRPLDRQTRRTSARASSGA